MQRKLARPEPELSSVGKCKLLNSACILRPSSHLLPRAQEADIQELRKRMMQQGKLTQEFLGADAMHALTSGNDDAVSPVLMEVLQASSRLSVPDAAKRRVWELCAPLRRLFGVRFRAPYIHSAKKQYPPLHVDTRRCPQTAASGAAAAAGCGPGKGDSPAQVWHRCAGRGPQRHVALDGQRDAHRAAQLARRRGAAAVRVTV